ncbi:MAG: amino acid ABC transporter permease [Candidatus Dormibacteraeota bacterium]|uniref:Amino acid ABC transporter permease n=1 Tax=Candidatus Aeolococcus gillhamiae TaxID=3127015 RepID=A0A934JUW8_9BACT|nr:amino acid ABC transporter permease [Candidatus Dormibacteraeota bacterium]
MDVGYYLRLLQESLPAFGAAAARTLLVSALAFALAVALGIAAAVGMASKFRGLRWALAAYVEVFRDTPLLLQIFIAYFATPALGLNLSPFQAGVATLALNGAAYLAVIFRAGLSSIPHAQAESAFVLALTPWQTFRRVLLPQAARSVYPAVVNQLIIIIQSSALLSAISYDEITSTTLLLNAQTFETMILFSFAMIAYLLLTGFVSISSGVIAKVVFRAPLGRQGK